MNAEANDLGARFYQEMGSDPGQRIGELVREALQSYAGTDRERASLVNVYNLLGDPALLLKQPDAPPPGGGPDAALERFAG